MPISPKEKRVNKAPFRCLASSALHSPERPRTFLHDVYVLTTRERAREARDTVAQAVQTGCGIAFNEGKSRVHGHPSRKPLTRNRRAGRRRLAGKQTSHPSSATRGSWAHRPTAFHPIMGFFLHAFQLKSAVSSLAPIYRHLGAKRTERTAVEQGN